MKFLTLSLLFQISYLTSVFAVCPDLGKCCTLTGACPSSSCVANGLGSNEKNCNVNTCPQSFCEVPKNTDCTGKCVGIVMCGASGCPYENNVCLFDGTSNNFKVCQGVQNCVVSDWSVWSPCVGGKSSRTRTITTPAANGGSKCPDLIEFVSCGTNPLLNDSGCGPQLLIHICTLDTTQPTTTCELPNLGNVIVPTLAGYTKMRFRINARGEYKS